MSEFDASKLAGDPEPRLPQRGEALGNLEYFLRQVVPVAERAGVRLAMHPDDPPLSPIRGVGRIMRSVDNYQRLLDLVPSECNGITLCQGNFALMTDDLPAVIRHFGRQKKIFFVHLRDVRGTPERFVETWHDEGQTDLYACMQAYREVGFDGPLAPTTSRPSTVTATSTPATRPMVAYMLSAISGLFAMRSGGPEAGRVGRSALFAPAGGK